MKFSIPALGLLLAGLAVPAARADVTGMWRITGSISGKAFALDCRFQPQGSALGGVCTSKPEGGGAGKTYALKTGSVSGGTVSWSYPAHYMFMSFNVNYTGHLDGNHMQGTVDAAGRQGSFTAVRE